MLRSLTALALVFAGLAAPVSAESPATAGAFDFQAIAFDAGQDAGGVGIRARLTVVRQISTAPANVFVVAFGWVTRCDPVCESIELADQPPLTSFHPHPTGETATFSWCVAATRGECVPISITLGAATPMRNHFEFTCRNAGAPDPITLLCPYAFVDSDSSDGSAGATVARPSNYRAYAALSGSVDGVPLTAPTLHLGAYVSYGLAGGQVQR